MIRSFRHKGLERFFRTGSKAGIDPMHAPRLRLQLARLDAASDVSDMNLPGWHLHPLAHDLAGHWAVWVDKNWRLTFAFVGVHAVAVDYHDRNTPLREMRLQILAESWHRYRADQHTGRPLSEVYARGLEECGLLAEPPYDRHSANSIALFHCLLKVIPITDEKCPGRYHNLAGRQV